MVKKRILKSIIYRIASLIWIQVMTWVLWGSLNTNLIVFITDIVITTPFYYFYDWIWDRYIGNV